MGPTVTAPGFSCGCLPILNSEATSYTLAISCTTHREQLANGATALTFTTAPASRLPLVRARLRARLRHTTRSRGRAGRATPRTHRPPNVVRARIAPLTHPPAVT
jgi:hypothetical protein